ncbi:TPA: Flp pilus assembly complex ATPase component TadA [Yersinia enterocolitica]|nr:type IV secretion system protein [Yersinia enterocolitica]HDL7601562.1 Flp pilus assembly complex ATPase component TadA [Yersinia enterocolitica]HDL7609401.1 Flp pilus assembly complex ATPase component TadA [Yersinia enterocolitica]HDL7617597.1 Flp pilus assembly complex ATPase component TadA [Yersinia enterocolitica]HDL7675884.1 Flp pilus assembly complex ATPase component TadA [Yersinia enterocolitica]
MTESLLKDSGFVDLYLGDDYTDIKGMIGASNRLAPAPEILKNDIESLRQQCLNFYNAEKRNEFSIFYGERLYRVTTTIDVYQNIGFVIRQTPNELFTLQKVGLSSDLIKLISQNNNSGLVLVSGKMGAGKTTTAAAMICHRIKESGNLGVSIEDPIETLLGGKHGDGRCIQLEVSDNEGYPLAIKRALRMGANNILIGEIRDAQTAHEVMKASLNGAFIVATIHANNCIDAIERYSIFCNEINSKANSIIAKSLFIVTNQVLMPSIYESNIRGYTCTVNGYDIRANTTIQAKIRDGNFQTLKDEFDSINQKQMRHSL